MDQQYCNNQMPPKRTKQQRQNYHFYCLCSSKMRYKTGQRLLNHIANKHGKVREMKENIYSHHVAMLNRSYLELYTREETQGPNFYLKDIDFVQSDIQKMQIIDNTLMQFYCEKFYQKYANLQDVYSADQIIEQGFTKKDLQIITQHQPDLHSTYELEQLQQIFSGFQQYAPMRHGKKGKLIDMKKELSRNFSLDWEPKIRLQIDLSTLRIKKITISQQLQRKIQSCEESMWKQDKQKIVRIINDYANNVVMNNLLLKASRS